MKDIINDDIRNLLTKGNCFDIIRYFFAITVVIAHFCELNGEPLFWFVSSYRSVKVFFILSGFLVFYSFIEKDSIKLYTDRRIKRVCPAYFFIVIACVVVGVLLTSLTAKEYLFSVNTYKYLFYNLIFLNFLQPELPGVFDNNIIHAVNGALWTIKVEVMFYISVPFVYYLMKRSNKFLVIISIFVLSILYNELFLWLYEKSGNGFFLLLRRQIGSQFIFFYSGTFVLLYFDYFQRYVKYIFPLAVLLYYFRNENMILNFLEPLTLTAIIIGIAYNFKYLNFLRKYDNISYGIYLFHFPIIQIIISLDLFDGNLVWSFCLCLLLTIICAILSWKFIEKPALKSKIQILK